MQEHIDHLSDVKLTLEIQNSKPVELIELTNSLIALSRQYNSYVSKNGYNLEETQSRLYVKEIKSGSYIFDLVELGKDKLLPFADHVNNIVGFSIYLKKAISYFTDEGEDKPDLNAEDCKEIAAFMNPIANDSASRLNVKVHANGDVHQHYYIDSASAKAMRDNLQDERNKLKEPKSGDIRENVVMVFYQTRSKLDAKTGNKVIIDDVEEKKAVNVLFLDKKLKKKILKGDDNPNNFGYYVDIQIKTANGKVVAYEVINYHEKFILDNP